MCERNIYRGDETEIVSYRRVGALRLICWWRKCRCGWCVIWRTLGETIGCRLDRACRSFEDGCFWCSTFGDGLGVDIEVSEGGGFMKLLEPCVGPILKIKIKTSIKYNFKLNAWGDCRKLFYGDEMKLKTTMLSETNWRNDGCAKCTFCQYIWKRTDDPSFSNHPCRCECARLGRLAKMPVG